MGISRPPDVPFCIPLLMAGLGFLLVCYVPHDVRSSLRRLRSLPRKQRLRGCLRCTLRIGLAPALTKGIAVPGRTAVQTWRSRNSTTVATNTPKPPGGSWFGETHPRAPRPVSPSSRPAGWHTSRSRLFDTWPQRGGRWTRAAKPSGGSLTASNATTKPERPSMPTSSVTPCSATKPTSSDSNKKSKPQPKTPPNTTTNSPHAPTAHKPKPTLPRALPDGEHRRSHPISSTTHRRRRPVLAATPAATYALNHIQPSPWSPADAAGRQGHRSSQRREAPRPGQGCGKRQQVTGLSLSMRTGPRPYPCYRREWRRHGVRDPVEGH